MGIRDILKDQVLKDLADELMYIKNAIQSKNIDQATRDKLFEKSGLIQSKINEILKKKGILTQTEADDIYEQIKSNKRKLLEQKSKRGFTAVYIGAAVLIIGIYLILKKKK